MIRQITGRVGFAALALSITLPAVAGPTPAPAKAPAKEERMWCPMMDLSVKKSKAKTTVVNGKTYYLCCDDCKKAFDKNPKKNAKDFDAKIAAHNKAEAAKAKKS